MSTQRLLGGRAVLSKVLRTNRRSLVSLIIGFTVGFYMAELFMFATPQRPGLSPYHEGYDLVDALGPAIEIGQYFDYRKSRTRTPKEITLSKDENETSWQRNWNDYEAIEIALAANGFGEVGRPANIVEYRMELYREYGYDALLSDHISLERTVPDTRPNDCKHMTQLSRLPKASVIVIFFNERLSVLLRTVHGIINRSPPELVQEIILVDDCSTYPELHRPLADYLRFHLPTDESKVRLIRIPERSGLMGARMKGAQHAAKEAEVLIFMDSHFEVNYNWLPPLLEPIAINPKCSTCPELDRISFKNFEYTYSAPFRGYFDWFLGYKFLGLNKEEYDTPAKNRREYVLMGAAIAIGAKFFWELGGFDDGMELWGGEQYELSFKIWMCGGEIITVPCSRMAHLYRDPDTKGNTNLYGNYNFYDRNIRRLIDVWMDAKHREYVYMRLPGVKTVDPGDLSERFAIRDRLQCKNFSWLLDTIMPDLKEKYLPIEPYPFGKGLIIPVLYPNKCIVLLDNGTVLVGLCTHDDPLKGDKEWIYNFRGEIRTAHDKCLETNYTNERVNSWSCHGVAGNQKWFYDREKQWFVHEEYNMCMVAGGDENGFVRLAKCDENNLSMKWTMSYLNQTEMDNWEDKIRYSPIRTPSVFNVSLD